MSVDPRRFLAICLSTLGCRESIELTLPEPGAARSGILFAFDDEEPLAAAISVQDGQWTAPSFDAGRDASLWLLGYASSLESLLLTPGPVRLAEAGEGRPLPAAAMAWRRAAADGGPWEEAEAPPWLEEIELLPVSAAECAERGGCLAVPEGELIASCNVPCPMTCEALAASDPLPEGALPLLEGCTFSGPVRGDECWSEPELFETLNGGQFPDSRDSPGSTSFEGEQTFLYFTSDRERGPDGANFTRPARAELAPDGSLVAGSIEDLGVLPPADDDPLGWMRSPQIRNDGLELFVGGSWPDAHWWDEELFLAARAAPSEPFGTLEVIAALGDPNNGRNPNDTREHDEVHSPLLLPDHRTLIYSAPWALAQQQRFARRRTTQAGDMSFEPLEASPFELNRVGTMHHSLSCDRRHVFYVRRCSDTQEFGLRIVALRSLEPLTFEPARDVLGPDGRPLTQAGGREILYVAESPDCQTLYLGGPFLAFTSRRQPCP